MSPSRLPAIVLALSIALPIFAQAPAVNPDEASRVGNLVGLCHLWNAVKYIHPWLPDHDIDWDAALVQAIPKVREATTQEEYEKALAGMLSEIGDPLTRIVPAPPTETARHEHKKVPLVRWLSKDTLLMAAGPVHDAIGYYALFTEMSRAVWTDVPKANIVIYDLRLSSDTAEKDNGIAWVISALANNIAPKKFEIPAQRHVVHWGFRPQMGSLVAEYKSGYAQDFGEIIQPNHPDTDQRIIFIVNETSGVPPLVAALRAAGLAKVVADHELDDSLLAQSITIDLPDGLAAKIRTSEIVTGPTTVPLHADAVVKTTPWDEEDLAVDKARELSAKPFEAPKPEPSPTLSPGIWKPDRAYAEMSDPSVAYRLLAAFRIWGVIHYFDPYLGLIGDWDHVLVELIPKFEAARDGKAYTMAVLEMTAQIDDSHTNVFGNRIVFDWRGIASPPIRVRSIEGKFVVTTVAEPSLEKSGELKIGDVVTSIDGVPFAKKVADLERYVAGSTETSRRAKATEIALRGPEGNVRITVEDTKGSHSVTLTRRRGPLPPDVPSAGDVVRVLPDNIGYVDLTRLQVADVDGMFDELRNTRAIIFDMRGYPNGTAWAIAPRINTRHATVAAQFRRPEVSAAEFGEEKGASYAFEQTLIKTTKWIYDKPTVMLIDERAISQSEHTALMFEAAAGTKFVGTPTAGANGDVTNFVLPGGLVVTFTGHDVRHADGRQLQRKGIQPDIEVAPTIAGLRAGKDEVLDRAVQYVMTGK